MYVGMYICIINLAHAQCMHLLSTCFSTTELVFIESRRIIKNECFDLMRIFSRGGGIELIHCKKMVFFVYREEIREDSLIFCSADDDRDETI